MRVTRESQQTSKSPKKTSATAWGGIAAGADGGSEGGDTIDAGKLGGASGEGGASGGSGTGASGGAGGVNISEPVDEAAFNHGTAAYAAPPRKQASTITKQHGVHGASGLSSRYAFPLCQMSARSSRSCSPSVGSASKLPRARDISSSVREAASSGGGGGGGGGA